jgi:hypothetical protein
VKPGRLEALRDNVDYYRVPEELMAILEVHRNTLTTPLFKEKCNVLSLHLAAESLWIVSEDPMLEELQVWPHNYGPLVCILSFYTPIYSHDLL